MSEPNDTPIDEHGKDAQLDEHRTDADGQYLTTNHGARVSHTDDSLKAGPRGPTLMEDFHFREKMTHFDHERMPERVVHARGSAAHGYFELYEPLTELTKAALFQDTSVRTPVFVRFSTVVGFRGSADTVRDVRGFATKFYTSAGNWDLVGNNMPVFFIQDGIKVPDLVHAIKPQPHHEMPQASAAHDNFWDFISLMPESAHTIMWVLSDRALPRSYRMMDGFGVHTFRFVNEQGKARFVKFHWRSTLGASSLVWDEAQKLAGKDPDFNRRDLWEAIEMGEFPEYELGIQVVEEEDEHRFDFDLLDATKVIPESIVPVRIVGKMTLNRNPDNFFSETEQVAFHPGHVVSGIDFTNDPLLQGRLFSYIDTQINRFSSANFNELPINRPLAPVHNNQRDGFMRQTINKGSVNYSPNSLGKGCPMTAPANMGGYVHHMERVEGHKVRERSESFKDHFSQPIMFWNGLTEPERERLISAAQFELGKVESKEVRHRLIHDFFNRIDHTLASRIATSVGIDPPAADASAPITAALPEVSVDRRTRPDSIRTRRIAILAADGVDVGMVESVMAALKQEGANAEVISKSKGTLRNGSRAVEVDKSFVTTGSVMYDAVFVPGGRASVDALRQEGDARHFVSEAFKHGKAIGATDEGVDLLMASDLGGLDLASDGESATSRFGVVVASGTSGGESMADKVKGVVGHGTDDDSAAFTARFVQAIAQHRHWDREMKAKVSA